MTDSNLHSQFIKENGILRTIYHEPFRPGSILFLQKFYIFFRCLFAHVIVNDTELAFILVTSSSQHFIHHLCRNRNLSGIKCGSPFLYIPYLLLDSR